MKIFVWLFFIQPPIKEQILLLLAKLLYTKGEYMEALKKFEEVNLDQVNLTDISNRHLKIIGEAFAIKGL